MRAKRPTLVITFSTTTQAMGAEKFFLERQLPGRIIPVPREITAGCGLAWKAPVEQQAALTAALEEAGMGYAAAQVVEI